MALHTNPSVIRAELLLNQRRYKEAAASLREALREQPTNSYVHSLLAISLAQLRQFDEATEHARQAVAHAPDTAQSHFSMAWVMVERRRWKESRAAADEAIALAPGEARFHWLLARICYGEHQWRQALHAAEQGLALDPEDRGCMNMRALCQLALGEKQQAAVAARQLLEKRPEDPFAHAHQGWTHLAQHHPRAAMDSFREALRLDANLEWAREGMVEALKARHWIYRLMIVLQPWRTRPMSIRRLLWMVVYLIAWPGSCWVLAVLASETPLPLWFWPLIGGVELSLLAILIASPLANLALRLHPFGYHVLTKDERRGTTLLSATLALPIPLLIIAYSLGGRNQDVGSALLLWLIAGPASMVYLCRQGGPRIFAFVMCYVPLMLGLIAAAPIDRLLSSPTAEGWRAMRIILFTAFLYFTLLACSLIACVRVAYRR